MQIAPIVHLVQAPRARELVHAAFVGSYGNGPLKNWGDRHSTRGNTDLRHPVHFDRACEARRRLLEVIDRLGSRNGERAESARVFLLAEHARVHAAIEAFERVVAEPGVRFPEPGGPVIEDLIERYEAALEAQAEAQARFNRATRANVRALRDALDDAGAALNELNAELAELARACAFPTLPDLAELARAEHETRELERASNVAEFPCRALELALRQGAGAPANVARAWVVFEPAKGELFDLRWKRYLEGGGAVETTPSDAGEPNSESSTDVEAQLRAGDFSAIARKKAGRV